MLHKIEKSEEKKRKKIKIEKSKKKSKNHEKIKKSEKNRKKLFFTSDKGVTKIYVDPPPPPGFSEIFE